MKTNANLFDFYQLSTKFESKTTKIIVQGCELTFWLKFEHLKLKIY